MMLIYDFEIDILSFGFVATRIAKSIYFIKCLASDSDSFKFYILPKWEK